MKKIDTPDRQLAMSVIRELFDVQGIGRYYVVPVVSILEGTPHTSVIDDLKSAAKNYPDVYGSWRKASAAELLKLYLEWNSIIGYDPLVLNRWKDPARFVEQVSNEGKIYRVGYYLAQQTIDTIKEFTGLVPKEKQPDGEIIYETNDSELAIMIVRLIQDYANPNAFGGITKSDDEVLSELEKGNKDGE